MPNDTTRKQARLASSLAGMHDRSCVSNWGPHRKDCNCGHDERSEVIAAALAQARREGMEDAAAQSEQLFQATKAWEYFDPNHGPLCSCQVALAIAAYEAAKEVDHG